ncbi:hypothetical protein HS088_TW11G01018 [Tripterygium wilfordii]|uniref:DUF7796 domain-containing protein n=1 Tax=Tripterygium wilfordii TaxID=458696 RepID=A0A7J7D4E4_TRIWF|nr:uncharacterized protein LOC120009767 [Tripterygium wilfordii]KAF5740936.1 hypothetical protein HS088_TW11G01018 [Tripterygium wilfordii]
MAGISPQKIDCETKLSLTKWFADLDWRLLFLIVLSLFLLVFISTPVNPFSSFSPIQYFFLFNRNVTDNSTANDDLSSVPVIAPANLSLSTEARPLDLDMSKTAVCLVGGARRFELTGPSIIQNVLEVYPNADLFLHSPLDKNAFKFSLLKAAPRLASIKIFEPKPISETDSEVRVLTSADSPNGIQGLLQYFNLVEGCLTLIQSYQKQKNFTYDWIVRTRVDGYWNAPLTPENFIPAQYVVPPGSSYGGLNDRLGVGDLNTTSVALSRLSFVPELDSAGFRQLNSETAFKAQLTTHGIPYLSKRLPFCIVTDREYHFPPNRFGVPVAALSSPGPLSGAKCRPCKPVCEGPCVEAVMSGLDRSWSWTNWENGTLHLCDAHGEWERGWERVFDMVAGDRLAAERKRVKEMKLKECVSDFEEMKRRALNWEAPSAEEICKLGLETT